MDITPLSIKERANLREVALRMARDSRPVFGGVSAVSQDAGGVEKLIRDADKIFEWLVAESANEINK